MRSYGIAGVAVMVTVGVGLAIQQFTATNPIAFLLFVPPVLVTAMWTDLRASLAATLMGGVAAEYFFRLPYLTLPKGSDEVVPLSLYLVIGAGISVLAQRLASAKVEAQAREADNARLYRQAEEANQLKDQFLATLSHELRTPLNALLGWIQLLRSGQLTDDKHDRALAAIERSAELQARLTADLLDVSAAMTGKLRLDRQLVDVPALIDGVVEAMQGAATEKGLQLHATVSGTGPMLVDPSRMQQIVVNLLSNAIKFTPAGGRVDIIVSEVKGDLCLVVADTGIGIRADFLPYVFDRFRQADAGPTREHAGLGLGLAIVRHLVELHGGTIEVASAPGEGTTFTARLPAAPVQPTPPARPRAAAPGPQSH